jgi:hypothetical protein
MGWDNDERRECPIPDAIELSPDLMSQVRFCLARRCPKWVTAHEIMLEVARPTALRAARRLAERETGYERRETATGEEFRRAPTDGQEELPL